MFRTYAQQDHGLLTNALCFDLRSPAYRGVKWPALLPGDESARKLRPPHCDNPRAGQCDVRIVRDATEQRSLKRIEPVQNFAAEKGAVGQVANKCAYIRL
jgi:hypothetical protein